MKKKKTKKHPLKGLSPLTLKDSCYYKAKRTYDVFPRLTHRGRLPNVEKTKKDNIMGIGPQNLGAPGMSGKSKPCGSPLKKISNSLDGPGASPLAQ